MDHQTAQEIDNFCNINLSIGTSKDHLMEICTKYQNLIKLFEDVRQDLHNADCEDYIKTIAFNELDYTIETLTQSFDILVSKVTDFKVGVSISGFMTTECPFGDVDSFPTINEAVDYIFAIHKN